MPTSSSSYLSLNGFVYQRPSIFEVTVIFKLFQKSSFTSYAEKGSSWRCDLCQSICYSLGVVWVCSGVRNLVLNFLCYGIFKGWKGGAYWEAIRLLSLAEIRVALCPKLIITIIRCSGVFILKWSLCGFVDYYVIKQIHTLVGENNSLYQVVCVWGRRDRVGTLMWPGEQSDPCWDYCWHCCCKELSPCTWGASGAGMQLMSSKQSNFLLVLEIQRSLPKQQQCGLSGKEEVLSREFLSHW